MNGPKGMYAPWLDDPDDGEETFMTEAESKAAAKKTNKAAIEKAKKKSEEESPRNPEG